MSDEFEDKIQGVEEENTLSIGEPEFLDALRLGNLDTAAQLLDEYKAANGETAFYHYRLALLNEKRGRLREAYDTFKRLYFENPAFMMGRNDYNRMVRLYLKDPCEDITKELKKAQADFFKALEKKRLEASQKHQDPASVPESTAFEFCNASPAFVANIIKRLEVIVEFEPDELDALNALLRIYLDKKDEEQADWLKDKIKDSAKLWKELLAKRSLSALAQASKLEASSKFETAIDIVNLGLETEPSNIDLLLFKTEVLQKMGCLKEALSCSVAILRIDQHNSQAFRLKKALESQIMEDNLSVGIELLQKAEQEAPGSPAQISKVRSAYGLLLDVISFDNENLIALAGVYRCNIRMGEPLKAQKVLERIRDIDESYDPYSIFRETGREGGESEACFVATRVFGADHPNTIYLRNFRDSFLKSYLAGRIFVCLYRRIGLTLAKLPKGSPFLLIGKTCTEKLVCSLKKIF